MQRYMQLIKHIIHILLSDRIVLLYSVLVISFSHICEITGRHLEGIFEIL